jgi:hypothetical protein
MRVRCPNCKRIFWETTQTFKPNVTPNGSMLRLLEPWRGNNWPIFGDGIMPVKNGAGTAGTVAAELDCPTCLAQLAPSGRLTVIEDSESAVEVSDEVETEVVSSKKKRR